MQKQQHRPGFWDEIPFKSIKPFHLDVIEDCDWNWFPDYARSFLTRVEPSAEIAPFSLHRGHGIYLRKTDASHPRSPQNPESY